MFYQYVSLKTYIKIILSFWCCLVLGLPAANASSLPSWNKGQYIATLFWQSANGLNMAQPGQHFSAQDTVVITADPCLALQAQEEIFDVYPNPVSNLLYINASENLQNVALFSSEGKLMMHINQNSAFVEMDMSLLASGIYILEITTHSGTYTQRIVKQ